MPGDLPSGAHVAVAYEHVDQTECSFLALSILVVLDETPRFDRSLSQIRPPLSEQARIDAAIALARN